jgi:hypothetical protein
VTDDNETVRNPYELNEPPKPEWLDHALQEYQDKLDFLVLKPKLEAIKPQMDTKFTTTTLELDIVLRKVRDVLNKFGVNAEFSHQYIAFGLELFRVWKRFRPQVWKWRMDWLNELKIIAQKWTNRGLDKTIMKEIAIRLNAEDINQFIQ